MNLQDIPIIICNFKHPNFTRRCVNSIRKFYPDVKFIIVDDKSPGYEPFNFPNSIEIRNKQHLGHGACIDIAVKHIKSSWFFTIDHDIVFTKAGYLEYLWEQKRGYAAVGPEHTYSDDGNYINAAAALWRRNFIRKYNLSFTHYDMPNRANINPGVMVCRKLEELGYKLNYLHSQSFKDFATHVANAVYASSDFKYGKRYRD